MGLNSCLACETPREVEDVGNAATALGAGHASGSGAADSSKSASQFAVGAPFSSSSVGSTNSTFKNRSEDSTTASSGGFVFAGLPSFSSGDQPAIPFVGAQGIVGTTGRSTMTSSVFTFGGIPVGSDGQQVDDRSSETSFDVPLSNLTEAKTVGLVETVDNDTNNKTVSAESVAAADENGATATANITYRSEEGQHVRNEAETAVLEEANSGDIEAAVEPVNDGEAAPGNDTVEVSSQLVDPILEILFCWLL